MGRIDDAERLKREQRLIGLTGSTHWQVLLISFYLPITMFAHNSITQFFYSRSTLFQKYIKPKGRETILGFLYDFTLGILPQLLTCIYYETFLVHIFLFTIVIGCLAIYFSRGKILYSWRKNPDRGFIYVPQVNLPKNMKRKNSEEKTQNENINGVETNIREEKENKEHNLPITNKVLIRAYGQPTKMLIICTCICILFVDFEIFPTTLAKTEKYGVSYMDIGTGLILFVAGMTARQIRGNYSLTTRLIKSSCSSLVVLFISMLRIVLKRIFNYQSIVSEYGVHWNFFLTIIVVTLGACFLPNKLIPWADKVGIGFMLFFQIILTFGNLSNYINYGERDFTSFIDQNREGLVQCAGYTSCYLCGIGFGHIFYSWGRNREGFTDPIQVFHKLMQFFFRSLIMFLIGYYFLEPTSRRIANLSYVAFCFVIGSGTMIIDFIWERSMSTHHTNLAVDCVEITKVLYFLAANGLVGLVNVTVNTLECDTFQSIAIMIGYLLVLHSAFAFAYTHKWKVKYW